MLETHKDRDQIAAEATDKYAAHKKAAQKVLELRTFEAAAYDYSEQEGDRLTTPINTHAPKAHHGYETEQREAQLDLAFTDIDGRQHYEDHEDVYRSMAAAEDFDRTYDKGLPIVVHGPESEALPIDVRTGQNHP